LVGVAFLAGAFEIALVFDDLAAGLLVVDGFLAGAFLTGALAKRMSKVDKENIYHQMLEALVIGNGENTYPFELLF
jgi:hypothetical protein